MVTYRLIGDDLETTVVSQHLPRQGDEIDYRGGRFQVLGVAHPAYAHADNAKLAAPKVHVERIEEAS